MSRTTDFSTDPRSRRAAESHGAVFDPGFSLHDYRIEGVLGRGGMGVVYRATDTKLNRSVAIKFLSSDLADPVARRRFQREAEIASALNHPHIVTVYDVAEHDGRQYIVSEFVDGGTLDAWAGSARRSWRQKVEMLTGVADALASAHTAGILHRDVKPGNILVGSSGYAKLADFGLAILSNSGAEHGDAASRYTTVGTIVGTVDYMSPEQAAGQPLGERSDVFSFGIVLYELLAGRRPFDAPSELEVLKSIVEAAHPPLPDMLPEQLRVAVDKTLEKDPDDRYQSMRELVVDLKRIARRSTSAQHTTATARPARRTWPAISAALAVALAAALVPATLYLRQPPAPPPAPVRFDMDLPPSAGFLALSPDAQTLAYVADSSGGQRVFLQTLGTSSARELPNTDNARGLFWSADGRALAFTANNALSRIDAAGGPPQQLAVSVGGARGTWSRDGTVLFTSMERSITGGRGIGVIASIAASGGTVKAQTTAGEIESAAFHTLPTLLPDGRRYVFVEQRRSSAAAPSEMTISLASLDSPDVTPILNLGASVGAPTQLGYSRGWLLFTKGGALLAQRVDTVAATLVGDAVEVADDVGTFSVAGDVLVYRPPIAEAPSLAELRWYDRSGTPLEVAGPAGVYGSVRLSPEGQRVAISITEAGNTDIWVRDLARNVPTRLTFDRSADESPLWSPDGGQIAFGSRRGRTDLSMDLYRRAANGSGVDELLLESVGGGVQIPVAWIPDRDELLFSISPGTRPNAPPLWRLPLTGERTPEPVFESKALVQNARLSPDGHWLAYATDESGRLEVVVQPYPNVERGKWQVSVRGGSEPRWRNDARELFYLAPDETLMAVGVDADFANGIFAVGPATELFRPNLAASRQRESRYDAAADGQRFLMKVSIASAAADIEDAPAHVIVNWTSTITAAPR